MYTRNLLYTDEKFELIAICWNKGHVTPIHDHAGSLCWMAVVQGVMGEEQFELKPSKDDSTFELKSKRKITYHPGEIGHITDEIGVHIIRNVSTGPSITLHIYAPPIKSCLYYESLLSRAKKRELSFYSAFGSIL